MLWTPEESITGRLWGFGERAREVGREEGREREGVGRGREGEL